MLDGISYIDLSHYERITISGNYVSPLLHITGQSIHYIRTISVTSPSFTMSQVRLTKQLSVLNYHVFYDRALADAQVLNATTASYFVQASLQVQLCVVSVTATTACVMQLQGSPDNSSWYAIGSTTSTTASITVVSTPTVHGSEYVRVIVTTAGTSQTLSFVAQSSSYAQR